MTEQDRQVENRGTMLTNYRKQRWLLPALLGGIMLIVVVGAMLG